MATGFIYQNLLNNTLWTLSTVINTLNNTLWILSTFINISCDDVLSVNEMLLKCVINNKSDDLSSSGMPDFFDRNKILSGYDLSHYQVPHCIRVFFYFVWFVFIHHNFQFYFKLCTYCNILDINLS